LLQLALFYFIANVRLPEINPVKQDIVQRRIFSCYFFRWK